MAARSSTSSVVPAAVHEHDAPPSSNSGTPHSRRSRSLSGQAPAMTMAEHNTESTLAVLNQDSAWNSMAPSRETFLINASEPELNSSTAEKSNSDRERSNMTDDSRPSSNVTDIEKGNDSSIRTPPRKRSLGSRIYRRFRANYWPLEEPTLIMPSPPTDAEKLLYLRTNRIPLYIFGVFAFLTLSAGMWLFTLSSPIFYWFAVFTVFLQIYLGVSYIVGIVGKDFDIKSHNAVLVNNPVTKENAPSIDIYLPVCLEPVEILRNTWTYVQQLEYPGKLQIHVLDDGDQAEVKSLASKFGFNYIVRGDRPRLRKAGNLRWAFANTTGDFFSIFDADFCPRSDFLLELLPEQIADEKVAIVQTPQFFRHRKEQTWTERGAGATQELFYRVVQVNRNRWGASICVGSNALYRRSAFVEVGGTAEIGFSEDVHTGFGAVDRGKKVIYLPICLATGICPDNPRAFFSQQTRWCMGSTTLLSNPKFWTSNLTVLQKICYACGFLYYSATAISIFLSPLPGILLLWVRPELFKYYNLAFAIPSIIYGVVVMPLWAKGGYSLNVQHIMVIQNYAYLNAIKDKIVRIPLVWAPTGDKKAHKSNKYRNMRIVAWIWWFAVFGGMITAVVWRLIHGFPWYHTLPLILLNAYNFYLAHPFLFWTG